MMRQPLKVLAPKQLIRVEVHFNARSKKPLSKTKSKRLLKVIGLLNAAGDQLDLLVSKDGWLAYDAARLLQGLRSHNETKMRLQVLKKNQTMRSFDVLTKYAPFLLIYSQSDNAEIEDDFIGKVNQKLQEKKVRKKRNADYYVYRNKNNQATDEELLKTHLEKFRAGGPSILRRRIKNMKHSNRRRKSPHDKNDLMLGFGTTAEDNQPAKLKNKDQSSSSNELAMVLLDDVHTSEKCGKRKMTINFEEIGWGDYVVQPASFEANYCSGTCAFHLEKFANGHALFQSLVHTAGLNPYVPNICCTPEKFDSQTMLYFQGSNLVLRTFPKMIVTSCSCS
ncbi:unnamed protein product [Enterobius vermicularis]|uniref:TGF_BETA_2 domain-containing protein n=1 Tax=Enterobius vermicularis TaxID=51028 RepID=A0A0N4VA38_ENTVE|nr:unnamed protein product [Enterobius vermicularis]